MHEKGWKAADRVRQKRISGVRENFGRERGGEFVWEESRNAPALPRAKVMLITGRTSVAQKVVGRHGQQSHL